MESCLDTLRYSRNLKDILKSVHHSCATFLIAEIPSILRLKFSLESHLIRPLIRITSTNAEILSILRYHKMILLKFVIIEIIDQKKTMKNANKYIV